MFYVLETPDMLLEAWWDLLGCLGVSNFADGAIKLELLLECVDSY
jgi:hypothetical protein